MSTLLQIGRGTVLLTSMALVACYIDVYTTGKFPWQHAAADTQATTVDSETWGMKAQHTMQLGSAAAVLTAVYPEMRDSGLSEIEIFFALSGSKSDVHGNRVVAQALYGTVDGNTSTTQPAQHTTPVFLPGSKSDVSASAVVTQPPAATPQTTTPIFMSGSKSHGGNTTVLSGALPPPPPANAQADQKVPSFMGGSKTMALPPRLPDSAMPNPTPTVSTDKMQFMGGTKSPGPIVMPSTTGSTMAPQYAPPATYPGTYPQAPATGNGSFSPNVSLQQDQRPASKPVTANANGPNAAPQFMSGSKSPFGAPPTALKVAPPPPVQQAAPPPLQITPKVVPYAPPPVQQAAPRFYGGQPVSPAKSY